MSSLYDELSAKVEAEQAKKKRGVPTFDLTLLMFKSRESIHRLWHAADGYLAADDDETRAQLQRAVDEMRPIFGERDSSPGDG